MHFVAPRSASDPTSAMFWLKNRDPENWRDVQNVDHVLGKYIISITQ
jgi:hypothetical protein